MKEQVVYSTKEVAERLNVHARTVRKWIDAFTDYVQPKLNNRGHYELSDSGLKALQDVQKRLKTGNKSLKQIREELVKSGRLQATKQVQADQITPDELKVVTERLAHIERVQRGTLESLGQLQAVIEDIRKKQDQLKLEIRNATFQQRLNAAGDGHKKRKKEGVLRLSQLFR